MVRETLKNRALFARVRGELNKGIEELVEELSPAQTLAVGVIVHFDLFAGLPQVNMVNERRGTAPGILA
ncbi:MAG TPA: hypothetical protein VMX16_03815 [Terriglobia bacterium]|nr:hypothetical protein [Terriglobia bacterium]